MKFVLYTNCVSAHQLPVACEMVSRLGASEVVYVYENATAPGNQCVDAKAQWITADKTVLQDCEILLVGGLRPVPLMERRAQSGRRTFYMSERWFKPPLGMLRLLHPKYFAMAWRVVRLIRNAESFIYLPIGIHAARDMARLCGLFAGDLRCLFRAPRLEFERKPGGRVFSRAERVETCRRGDEDFDRVEKRYCLDKMRMWGYFVKEGKGKREKERGKEKNRGRVLWVGRMLGFKRVDTIIRAVGEISTRSTRSTRLNISLDIYGAGPEEMRLRKLASKYGDAIKFHPPVPIEQVRKLMREHDVYVLASNAYEGWGAVVSEALEEGMTVIGTYEAGSSATMLSENSLFHAGDWRRLMQILQSWHGPCEGLFDWTAEMAASALLTI